MKVAIFLTQKFPEQGGCFTFENEILRFLFEYASQSHHEFLLHSILRDIPQSLKDLKPKNIQIIYPNLNGWKNWQSKITRHGKAILNKLSSPENQYRVESWFEKWIKDSLNDGIADISWSFTSTCPTFEIPYVTTIWDLQHRLQPYFPEVNQQGEWTKREKKLSALLKRASFIITGTQRGKTEIERFYQVASERIKVIPFPTPSFVLNCSQEKTNHIFKKYQIPPNYLFYPAQFWSHKNHIGLLLALKELKDNYNLILPVVFTGSDQGNLSYVQQWIKKLDLSKQVYFLGFVSKEDLIELYRHAFALTYLTFFGPDNLPPLEAFALGCPVIASKLPGSEEQLGEAALLVNPKNEKQIALAIKSLYDQPDLRDNLIQKGLLKAFSWTGKDYIQSMISILDEFETIRRCWK